MTEPSIPVGFDYARAVLEIRKFMTYEEIAAFLGYESVGSIGPLLKGRIPNHPQGEAIYTLYRELFGKKPPMTQAQAIGAPSNIHERACGASPSSL